MDLLDLVATKVMAASFVAANVDHERGRQNFQQ